MPDERPEASSEEYRDEIEDEPIESEERPVSPPLESIPEPPAGSGVRFTQFIAVALVGAVLFAAGLLARPLLFPTAPLEETLAPMLVSLREEIARTHQDLGQRLDTLNGHIEGLREQIDRVAQGGERAATEEPSPDDDPSLGSEEAPVLIIAFSDYQCPYCRRFHEQTFPDLKREFIDTGKVRFVHRDFPLTQIHRYAGLAALAAECADEQGRFWEMHDLLFRRQTEWASAADARERIEGYGQDLGLDGEALSQCIDDQSRAQEILKDLQDGVSYGVQGTPAFFINGQKLEGAQPFSAFKQVIEAELSE